MFRRLFVGVASLLTVAAVASCSVDGGNDYSGEVNSSTQLDEVLVPGIKVSSADRDGKPAIVKDGAVGVQPGAPIVVSAVDGRLTSVRIDKADGSPVRGAFSEGGRVWTSAEPFGYNRSYSVVTEARSVGGTAKSRTAFTTKAPNNLTQAYLTPSPGETVGVGQPVSVKFDEPIKDRKAAEAAIKVTTDPPVPGAFYWISDTDVRWRPAEYWKPGTKVSVDVRTYGIDLGDGLFGQENVKTNFVVGRKQISRVSDNDKIVRVERDGKVIRSMPTSMGKPGDETDNGIYLVADKHDMIIMDSSTYGVPVNSSNGYRTPVNYATRMSFNGIFFHSAPWSVWAQGNTNTSHGCLNLSPDDALWIMENSLRGDPVIVTDTTGGTLAGTDGLGDWNIPWEIWQRGNAS
ncbi:L,D-transpeptidase [Jongsikchunia kroppenstedtii]|uniref:L,D-transpeptidase n=1 Tax=Jongsikchunia kroppenstedtii TaxID=1121721 RepID=UPI0003785896|nr:Ig-like domain-containing protein [Jongsikchunia kroppenstedtii]